MKASVDQLKSDESQAGAKTKEELEALQKSLEAKNSEISQKNAVMIKIKAIAREFRTKNETLTKEIEAKNAAIANLEEEVKKLKESPSRPTSGEVGNGDAEKLMRL